MNWLLELNSHHPVAFGLLVLCLVAVVGLAIGSIRIRGISLGVAGVLFSGILFGHFGLNIDAAVRTFVQEFGLILFVYTIGMQVGPSFVSSLRKSGLPLNLLAATIVLSGAAVMLALCFALNIDIAAGVGLFSGATTNTPSLGAAQQAMTSVAGLAEDRKSLPALGYAVCYPFGIMGIILAMMLVRAVARINVPNELKTFQAAQRAGQESLQRMNLLVENPNLNGLQVRQVPALKELNIVLSRHQRAGTTTVTAVTAETVLGIGDTVLAIGTAANLQKLLVIAGKESSADLLQVSGSVVIHRRVIITHKEVLGKSLRELGLDKVFGVTATRVTRADLEIPVSADTRLQFGDMLMLVGTQEALDKAGRFLGNSIQQLNHTKLIPMFLGIALGVLVGSYPMTIGSIPVPVSLGLAGGPLLVAIILSRIGQIGPLLWYMPVNANTLLREFGIVLFLSCVGLRSGSQFVNTLLQGDGLLWMGVGAAITVVPLLIAAYVGRALMKMNYVNICGLLSGSMTDPPALAFANSMTGSDAPAVAYATVYPLTMLLRIVVAQLIVIFFCR